MIEISVKNRILKIFFKSVELFQISSEKKWLLIRRICIPFCAQFHNRSIQNLWTFEILFNSRNSLGSLITLLGICPLFQNFRYTIHCNFAKLQKLLRIGRGGARRGDGNTRSGIDEIFQNWRRTSCPGSVLRLSWLEYNASGVEDSQKRGRGLYRLRFTGHPTEKTRGL